VSLSRRNVVRYVTPTVSGFAASASWGEDDTWDVALRYAGEIGGFRIGAGAAYAQVSDSTVSRCIKVGADGVDCHSWGGSASIMHVATGLFLNGSYAVIKDENKASGFNDASIWSVQGGIEQKWFALGKTTLYGVYVESDSDQLVKSGAVNNASSFGLAASGLGVNAKVSTWGIGFVQGVDAAALDLFVSYYNSSADVKSNATGAKASIEDFQAVITGASIKF
jgi:hypothetical protein